VPWFAAMGFSHSVVTRIKKGFPPSPDLVLALVLTERVSPRWLLDDVGPKYIVSRVLDDDEAARVLEHELKAEWGVLLATADDKRFAVLLHTDAAFLMKNQEIAYRRVHVVTGNISLRTLRWLSDIGRGMWLVRLTPEEMERLDAGDMGNLEIWGWEDKRRKSEGLISRRRQIDSMLHDSAYVFLHHEGNGEPPHPGDAKEGEMATQLNELTGYFERLDAESKAVIINLLKVMSR